MTTMVKKLFKHGGSHAVDLPREFVKQLGNQDVILYIEENNIVLQPKSKLDTIESEPAFALFVRALAEDSMKHPQKLKSSKDVWDKEWDKLLSGVSIDANK